MPTRMNPTQTARAKQAAESDAQVASVFNAHSPKVLIIGAAGQIGVDLAHQLLRPTAATSKSLVETKKLTLADLGPGYQKVLRGDYPADVGREQVDITKLDQVNSLIKKTNPDIVIDLAALLSSQMKDNPAQGFAVNAEGPLNLIKAMSAGRASNQHPIFFVPSSIAAASAKGVTPAEREGFASQYGSYAHQSANTYADTKVIVEALTGSMCRPMGIVGISPRFPIVASHTKVTGSGTTDYVVEIFKRALRGEVYVCPIAKDRKLPIISGDDVIRTIIYPIAKALDTKFDEILQKMTHVYHYNVPGASLSPQEIYGGMIKCLPEQLKRSAIIKYEPDFRDGLAAGYYAQSEGRHIKEDCFNFQLQHEDPEQFTLYMLKGFSQRPDLLYQQSDSENSKAQIDANCRDLKTYLFEQYGV